MSGLSRKPRWPSSARAAHIGAAPTAPSTRRIITAIHLEILRDTEPGALEFAHTHYDHAHVAQDPNVGFPLGLLRILEAEGVIGRLVDPAISFSGFLPQTRQLLTDTAPAAAKRLLEAGAQSALLVPC
ncbi:MAG: hypothetical protein HZB20_04635 [Chloroflexi bacterium]|nr:hypothetical protein [Chloroflexota bacterium]